MLRVVLVEPEGEYNVGFIARLCKNFGVDELYIVNPKCDLKKAVEFSAKGSSILLNSKVVDKFTDAIYDLDLKISTSSIADSKGDMLRKSISPWEMINYLDKNKIGLIFGRESVGLTREEIFMTDLLVHIPGNPDYPVLNLSHAVGIILYEIWRSRLTSKENSGIYHGAISSDTLKLIDKYLLALHDLVRKSDSDGDMYLALKRSIIRGLKDEEEGRAIVRFLRKTYMKIIHSNE
ncbi:RNA methyltransferase [Metallosphaera tengchongensis]|uniref:RNA methyltransferase n=1 Tax=Metallosphaera tengchongensis TaxID=1532350 RepID=A0A6N0NW70_9CREN|nr:tRNA (cytidine-2'-O-)-methyltransferase TrmJ [Metallosphaera tengchongensis]QKQ99898.1 RNA methyltransferase [Metallosphaera tengchongensis]